MLLIAEFNDLIGKWLYVHQSRILILLKLELVGLSVHDHDGGDDAAILEAASLLHQLIDNIDGWEGLTC